MSAALAESQSTGLSQQMVLQGISWETSMTLKHVLHGALCHTSVTLLQLSADRGLLLFGDEEDGPGVYPQLLSATAFNTSDLSLVDGENETWVVTRGMGGAYPAKRSDPAVAHDGASILIHGGRSVE